MKSTLKMVAAVMAMGFCILFGVSLATQGTERIQGPLFKTQGAGGADKTQPRAYSAAPAGKTPPTEPAKAPDKPKTAAPQPERPERAETVRDTGVNRVGNKTGDLLQIAAYHGIRFFVDMIEAIIS